MLISPHETFNFGFYFGFTSPLFLIYLIYSMQHHELERWDMREFIDDSSKNLREAKSVAKRTDDKLLLRSETSSR